MTFEIVTEIFLEAPWYFTLMAIIGIMLSVGCVLGTIIVLVECDGANKLYALLTLIGLTAGIALVYYGNELDNTRIADNKAHFSQVLEEHGLTKYTLDNDKKTFTAKDKDGRFMACGMIPLDDDYTFEVICRG